MSNTGYRRLSDNWRDHRNDTPAEDDPLSELARLIEEDPFADFDRDDREQPAPAAQQDRWAWEEAGAEDDAVDPVDAPAHWERPAPEQYAQEEIYPGDRQAGDPWGDPQAEDPWEAESIEPADLYGGSADVGEDDARAEPTEEEIAYAPVANPFAPVGRARAADDVVDPGDAYLEARPHYDDSGHLPPLTETAEKPRSRKMLVFAALALVAMAGGAGAYFYQQTDGRVADGPPILVAASTDPVKVRPENPGGAQVPNQDKVVFDRAAGVQPAGKTEERIVSREEPVEDVKLRASAEPGATSQPASNPNAPRRVRTVVVKPDGTIVESNAPTQNDRVASLDTTGTTGGGPVALYESSADIPSAPAARTATEPADNSVPSAPAASAPSGTAPSGTPDAAMQTGVPAAEGQVGAANTDATGESKGATSSGVPFPPSRPAGTRVASVSTGQSTAAPRTSTSQPAPAASAARSGQPMELVPQASNAGASQTQVASAPSAQATSGFPSGSYVVQVSSARSQQEAEAMVSRVEARYGKVISGYETAIQRADLGDRGVFYRVAVGPLSDTSSATGLCNRLKSAGLDCFVRRN